MRPAAAQDPEPYTPAPYTPAPQRAAPQAPAGQPTVDLCAGRARSPTIFPTTPVLPPRRAQPAITAAARVSTPQPAYNAPVYQPPPQRALPALGPMRGPNATAAIMPAAVTPPATLACPMVSALDRWVSEGVQPAALHWFGAQVTEIKQIGSYSCREMVGSGTSSMSEHAFGDALDIAGFTLADGRKITVKDGWHGTPEEQGFLHDVQLYACETFTTVLAPGYNVYHYDHIHVDLMRRRERRPAVPAGRHPRRGGGGASARGLCRQARRAGLYRLDRQGGQAAGRGAGRGRLCRGCRWRRDRIDQRGAPCGQRDRRTTSMPSRRP